MATVDTDASWLTSLVQEVGQTDFTKPIQFGAEVSKTDASLLDLRRCLDRCELR